MLRNVEKIMREAAQIMLKARPSSIQVKEGHANFVTKADRDTQAFLQERLTALLPGSEVFGEEKVNGVLGDGPTWVVDPIDGTLNYMRGLEHSAISVALTQGKALTLGAVYNPYKDEMFTAMAGGGAFLNGSPIRCSETPFERALAFFGSSPYDPAMVRATFQAVQELMLRAADIRRMGSAALDLAYVACGRAELFFEYSLSPWDYAAGSLLVREAGGTCRLMNIPGPLLDFSNPAAVFAANPPCRETAYEIVHAAYQQLKGS